MCLWELVKQLSTSLNVTSEAENSLTKLIHLHPRQARHLSNYSMCYKRFDRTDSVKTDRKLIRTSLECAVITLLNQSYLIYMFLYVFTAMH